MREPETLTFARPGGGRLHVGPDALVTVRSYRQTAPDDMEAGGVLLGRYLLGSPDVVVDRVTTPLPGDRRTRTSFYRHHAGHQALIDQAWTESGGRCAWLGEWHTHPEPSPAPSWVDRRDWRRRLKRDVYDEVLFFLIVGTQSTSAWEGKPPRHITLLDNAEISTEPTQGQRVVEEARDAETKDGPPLRPARAVGPGRGAL